MTPEDPSSRPTEFILTREHRRFAEFCDACRQARYIGLCYGVPGVGKTVSARQYADWNQLESLMGGPPPYRHSATPPRDSGPWQTVLFTPGVTNTPRTVEHAVSNLWGQSTASELELPGMAIQTQPWFASRLICSWSMKPTDSRQPALNSYATSTTADTWAWCSSVCRGCRSDSRATLSCTHALASCTSSNR